MTEYCESNIQRQAMTLIAIGMAHGMMISARATPRPRNGRTSRNASVVPSTILTISVPNVSRMRVAQRGLEDAVLPGPGEIVESDELRVGAADGLIGERDPDRQRERIPDQQRRCR